MAVTKHFRIGAPSDDGEITEASTFKDNMEGGVGPSCATQTLIANTAENVRIYDKKQAGTYAAGVWNIITDWNIGQGTDGIITRIIVTDNTGSELREIAAFGLAAVEDEDFTQTTGSLGEQTLTADERLCVNLQQGEDEDIGLELDNFSTSCNSRLVTPDFTPVAGAPTSNKPLIINQGGMI